MLSSSVARLTKQFAQQLSVTALPRLVAAAAATPAAAPRLVLTSLEQRASFATKRKVIDAKNVKRLKIQAKKKKNVNNPASSVVEDAGALREKEEASQPFLQHQEWVKFQQEISVDGFQTGQITTAAVLKKSRGGKQARRKKEKEMARMEQFQSAGDEKFPALRYSPEETEELLKRAYAALPPRAGKRGTRNLRRQDRRWKLVRDIRSKYKSQISAAHERRMEKRHWKREMVKSTYGDAPALREKDLNYQGQVLKRWADNVFGDQDSTIVEVENAAAKVGIKE